MPYGPRHLLAVDGRQAFARSTSCRLPLTIKPHFSLYQRARLMLHFPCVLPARPPAPIRAMAVPTCCPSRRENMTLTLTSARVQYHILNARTCRHGAVTGRAVWPLQVHRGVRRLRKPKATPTAVMDTRNHGGHSACCCLRLLRRESN